MMRIIGMLGAAVVGGLLTTSCSSSTDTGPDRSNVPDSVVAQVAEHQGSCEDLQTLFDGADFRNDTDSMDYIDATMRAAGCYDGGQ